MNRSLPNTGSFPGRHLPGIYRKSLPRPGASRHPQHGIDDPARVGSSHPQRRARVHPRREYLFTQPPPAYQQGHGISAQEGDGRPATDRFSAGAILCGPNILTSKDMNTWETSVFAGLNLTPFNFSCHYPQDEIGQLEKDEWLAEYHVFHDNSHHFAADGAYIRGGREENAAGGRTGLDLKKRSGKKKHSQWKADPGVKPKPTLIFKAIPQYHRPLVFLGKRGIIIINIILIRRNHMRKNRWFGIHFLCSLSWAAV